MNSEPKGEIRKVTDADLDYPKVLREISVRPAVLYVRGRWPLPEDGLTLGVVGSRHATPYGREAAQSITAGLVRAGAVIVSGLAAGIDACSHRATLEQRGWTVAILGHGFGHLFPQENASLFDEIAEHGTLVTEFPYDAPPLAAHFPQRNRIISGLSQGVVVVEAGEHSGALITARCAAEQGRDVFAVPGSVFSPLSLGCHRLIKEGARLVEKAGDILMDYGVGGNSETPPRRYKGKVEDLTAFEKEILQALSAAPLSVDELVELSRTPVDRLAEVLLSLELKERVRALPGQRYVAYD